MEETLRQQEDTTQLLAQIVDVQATNKRLHRENEELVSLVGVARECQQELTTELADLKEKYAEVLDLLHDTQEQLRKAQKKVRFISWDLKVCQQNYPIQEKHF